MFRVGQKTPQKIQIQVPISSTTLTLQFQTTKKTFKIQQHPTETEVGKNSVSPTKKV